MRKAPAAKPKASSDQLERRLSAKASTVSPKVTSSAGPSPKQRPTTPTTGGAPKAKPKAAETKAGAKAKGTATSTSSRAGGNAASSLDAKMDAKINAYLAKESDVSDPNHGRIGAARSGADRTRAGDSPAATSSDAASPLPRPGSDSEISNSSSSNSDSGDDARRGAASSSRPATTPAATASSSRVAQGAVAASGGAAPASNSARRPSYFESSDSEGESNSEKSPDASPRKNFGTSSSSDSGAEPPEKALSSLPGPAPDEVVAAVVAGAGGASITSSGAASSLTTAVSAGKDATGGLASPLAVAGQDDDDTCSLPSPGDGSASAPSLGTSVGVSAPHAAMGKLMGLQAGQEHEADASEENKEEDASGEMHKLILQLEEQQIKVNQGLLEAIKREESARIEEQEWCNSLHEQLAEAKQGLETERRQRVEELRACDQKHQEALLAQEARWRREVQSLQAELDSVRSEHTAALRRAEEAENALEAARKEVREAESSLEAARKEAESSLEAARQEGVRHVQCQTDAVEILDSQELKSREEAANFEREELQRFRDELQYQREAQCKKFELQQKEQREALERERLEAEEMLRIEREKKEIELKRLFEQGETELQKKRASQEEDLQRLRIEQANEFRKWEETHNESLRQERNHLENEALRLGREQLEKERLEREVQAEALRRQGEMQNEALQLQREHLEKQRLKCEAEAELKREELEKQRLEREAQAKELRRRELAVQIAELEQRREKHRVDRNGQRKGQEDKFADERRHAGGIERSSSLLEPPVSPPEDSPKLRPTKANGEPADTKVLIADMLRSRVQDLAHCTLTGRSPAADGVGFWHDAETNAVFNMLDRNGDGVISRAEWNQAEREMPSMLTENSLQQLVLQIEGKSDAEGSPCLRPGFSPPDADRHLRTASKLEHQRSLIEPPQSPPEEVSPSPIRGSAESGDFEQSGADGCAVKIAGQRRRHDASYRLTGDMVSSSSSPSGSATGSRGWFRATPALAMGVGPPAAVLAGSPSPTWGSGHGGLVLPPPAARGRHDPAILPPPQPLPLSQPLQTRTLSPSASPEQTIGVVSCHQALPSSSATASSAPSASPYGARRGQSRGESPPLATPLQLLPPQRSAPSRSRSPTNARLMTGVPSRSTSPCLSGAVALAAAANIAASALIRSLSPGSRSSASPSPQADRLLAVSASLRDSACSGRGSLGCSGQVITSAGRGDAAEPSGLIGFSSPHVGGATSSRAIVLGGADEALPPPRRPSSSPLVAPSTSSRCAMTPPMAAEPGVAALLRPSSTPRLHASAPRVATPPPPRAAPAAVSAVSHPGTPATPVRLTQLQQHARVAVGPSGGGPGTTLLTPRLTGYPSYAFGAAAFASAPAAVRGPQSQPQLSPVAAAARGLTPPRGLLETIGFLGMAQE